MSVFIGQQKPNFRRKESSEVAPLSGSVAGHCLGITGSFTPARASQQPGSGSVLVQDRGPDREIRELFSLLVGVAFLIFFVCVCVCVGYSYRCFA